MLDDFETAPPAVLDEKLRTTLRFLRKVTEAPDAVGPDDVRPMKAAGVSRQAAEDALLVAFCFNLITRLADSFGWYVPDQGGFDASAKVLLKVGYLMPMRGKPAAAGAPIK